LFQTCFKSVPEKQKYTLFLPFLYHTTNNITSAKTNTFCQSYIFTTHPDMFTAWVRETSPTSTVPVRVPYPVPLQNKALTALKKNFHPNTPTKHLIP
jgi:hypothetical protein